MRPKATAQGSVRDLSGVYRCSMARILLPGFYKDPAFLFFFFSGLGFKAVAVERFKVV